jgi:NADH-quinone oxidoreductase subunit A
MHLQPLWPFAIYALAVIFITASIIIISYFLGQRHSENEMGEPYESGIVSTGSARMRFDVKFYMIAMFFIIFDLEAVFIFAWSVALAETGWSGYFVMLIFIMVLFTMMVYLWRIGALEWGSRKRKTTMARGNGVYL